MTILVAGGTGNLGGRIIKALLDRDGDVRAVVRSSTDGVKVGKLEQRGVKVIRVDMSDVSDLMRACDGVDCVVSSLSGLRDVIIGAQSMLLNAAIAAGVPRFIPSDYAIDFTKLSAGTNRNLDLRREFHEYLDKASISATSILSGAFADMLVTGRMQLFNLASKRVSYYGDADQRLDFTTTDNIAAFTAEAALDPTTPRILRIAGDQISPREMADVASEVTKTNFELVRLGSLEDFTALIQQEQASDPQRETNMYPKWQAMQYSNNMFSGRAKLEPLDNDRYPDMKWTSVRDLIAAR